MRVHRWKTLAGFALFAFRAFAGTLFERLRGAYGVAAFNRLIPFAALLFPSCPALAEPQAALCATAEKSVQADLWLASEVAAVFGKAKFVGKESDCLYPLMALRYASADLLLVQTGEPGEGCHGCGAALSAYVIQRVNGGLRPVRKFREFAEIGTNGSIMEAWPIQIAGDDALAIQGGGTFQGHTSSAIFFFVFRAGLIVDLGPNPPVTLDADNSGAMDDQSQAIAVTGSWFFDPSDKSSLVVDYKIDAKGATRVERVVWRVQGGKLVLSKGQVPQEVTDARGG